MPIVSVVATRRLVRQQVDRHVSSTPVVGAIFSMWAVMIAPLGSFRDRFGWCLLPFVVEAVVVGLSVAYWRLSGLEREVERVRRAHAWAREGSPT